MGLFSCPGEPGRRGRRIRTGRSCAARGTLIADTRRPPRRGPSLPRRIIRL